MRHLILPFLMTGVLGGLLFYGLNLRGYVSFVIDPQTEVAR